MVGRVAWYLSSIGNLERVRRRGAVWGAEVLKAFGSGGGGDDGAPSGRAAVQAPLPEPASAAGAPAPESHLLVRSFKNL